MALELGSGHVGIIQTSPDAIARLGRVKSSSAPPGSRRAEIQTLLEGVRSSANQEVRDVRNTNQLQRIAAKHEGIVRDIPMPIEYKLSRAHLRGDFNFSSESFSQLNFEGAIW